MLFVYSFTSLCGSPAVRQDQADIQLLMHQKSAGGKPKEILFPGLAASLQSFGRSALHKDEQHMASLAFDAGYLLSEDARRMLKGKRYEPLAISSAVGPPCPSEVGLWDKEAAELKRNLKKTRYEELEDLD